MAQKITVRPEEWLNDKNRFRFSADLEAGDILFFPTIPFAFPLDEIGFLLERKDSDERRLEILRNYSNRVTDFLTLLLPCYAKEWKLDDVNFRLSKGKDFLHVDSFPKKPLHGSRILRFFTNINPVESKKWVTSQSFEELAKQFGGEDGISFPAAYENTLKNRLGRKMRELLGIPMRSPYDVFMLNMHTFLKENESFQATCQKDHWEFPPNSCWAVFTDQVSHASLSGQSVIEQTLIIPQNALIFPEKAPVHVLEYLTSRNMIDSVAQSLASCR